MMVENRTIRLIAHLFFLGMLLFAAKYAVARMLFADGSFYLFKMTCSGHFNIEAGRYSAFLTQIIPVALINLHAPLKVVILGYSLSFILVYYLFFIISLRLFSSLKAAVAITLALVLGVSDSSMYPISEMQLGIISSVLFYAFTEYFFIHEKDFPGKKKILLVATGILIILMCMFSHPSTLFLLLFIIAFQAINKGLFRNRMGSAVFYTLFALAVTTSVQMVGIYLVFASLIIPAITSHGVAKFRLPLAYLVGMLGYTSGLLLSVLRDLPSGAAIVWSMAICGAGLLLLRRMKKL